ncbi:host specificity factor TipJ family phage tail protein [Nevskia sp.]|uniref:host specificity factor TipJ family phage tail protein n=1 Tax=Nevskia sp. TaxID=1929292 RepID=UPI003F6F5D9E
MGIKKLLKVAAAPLLALNAPLIKAALKLITPKIPKLQTNAAVEQVNDLRAQNNSARLGEPQTILYGVNDAYFPAMKAQPWIEFENNEPVLHVLMRVSVGICTLAGALRVGKSPITAFPGSRFELLRPGEPMTLFHGNVFTAEQLNGIELVAGIFQTIVYTDTMTFSGNQVRVPNDAASIAARAAAGVNPFRQMTAGLNVVISGSPSNDGTYRVASVDGSGPIEFFTVTTTGGAAVTFTSETALATVSWGNYQQNGVETPAIGGVAVTFDNASSEIRAAALPGNPRPLDIFLPGDIITATTSGAGANRYVPFTVLAITDAGAFVVSPSPASLSGTTDVWLLRRTYGPYPVCGPGDMLDEVAYDLVWPGGIGAKGGSSPITMRFDPQYQVIDDAGTPLGGWISFPTIEVTAASRRPYRRSFRFPVSPPARLQLRLAQLSVDSNSAEIVDSVQWVGARGYVRPRPGEQPEVDADSTCLAVSLRATNAASAGDDLKINGSFQRWLETWSAGSGWGPEVPTRSVVWAALDKLRGRYTARGRQVPDAELDLPAFAALEATLAARGDCFDGQQSVPGNLRENANEILALGRAELVYRWQDSILSVSRDEARTPKQLFVSMNSTLYGYQLRGRTDNDPTGVQVSYTEPAFADEGIVGIGDTDALPLKLDLRNGCRSRQRAWEAGQFAWAVSRYRNQSFQLSAELEPLLLHEGDRVLVQSRPLGWGQAAHVVSASGRNLVVWPPLAWTPGGNRVILRNADGSPGAMIGATRGATDAQLTLAADPDVTFTNDASSEQRTLLAFFNANEQPVTAIVTGISWSAGSGPVQRATMQCTVDDDRVHANPGPAPIDPFAPVINPPALAITGLTATTAGTGAVTVSWTAVPAAILYETEWRYTGALSWTTARRGAGNAAGFTVSMSGVIEIRVRAFSSGAIGDYSQISRTVTISGGGGGPLTVSRSPAYLYGYTTGSLATTDLCSSTAAGGVPPYTYNWELVSSTGGLVLIGSATSSATRFSAPGLSAGERRTAVARQRVTDSIGTVVFSANTDITLEQYSTGGTPGGVPSY